MVKKVRWDKKGPLGEKGPHAKREVKVTRKCPLEYSTMKMVWVREGMVGANEEGPRVWRADRRWSAHEAEKSQHV